MLIVEVGRVEVLVVVVRAKVVLYNYVNAIRPVIGRCPHLLEYRYMDNGFFVSFSMARGFENVLWDYFGLSK